MKIITLIYLEIFKLVLLELNANKNKNIMKKILLLNLFTLLSLNFLTAQKQVNLDSFFKDFKIFNMQNNNGEVNNNK